MLIRPASLPQPSVLHVFTDSILTEPVKLHGDGKTVQADPGWQGP